MDETVLDRAFAAMAADPEDHAARLRFYERVADAELYVLQETEARFAPRVFPLETGPVVLAFDHEARLAEFAGGATAYSELSGRTLVPLLAEKGLGLGLNLEVAPSSYLMPAEVVRWLADALAARPEVASALPERFEPPGDVPETLVSALDAKFSGLAGLARKAHLAVAQYGDGRRVPLLAFEGWRAGAEDALARAVGEALIFSGLENWAFEVVFPQEKAPYFSRLTQVALGFDLPEAASQSAPTAPGLDPARPPRLR